MKQLTELDASKLSGINDKSLSDVVTLTKLNAYDNPKITKRL